MKGRGKMLYVPKDVIEEIKNIQLDLDISRPEAFRKMVKFCRNGRFNNIKIQTEIKKNKERGFW